MRANTILRVLITWILVHILTVFTGRIYIIAVLMLMNVRTVF